MDDADLKQRHRTVWAAGSYPDVARDVIPGLGPALVEAVGIHAGDRVLDVAAGTGNAAVPAARAGASVVASDLTPELVEAGRAEHADLPIEWGVADAEDLPYGDASFDVVLSCIGVMFAPHHQQAADELARVLRPGGRLGLASWTPEGFVGRLFATVGRYNPPPPPGAQPPPLWGKEDHVRDLLGGAVAELQVERRTIVVDHFASPGEFRDYFTANFGPVVMALRGLADEPDRAAQLGEDLEALAADADEGGGRMSWEYLLVTGTRA